jgi:two-component system, OmpR family, alkaline phosphatase synthesis response regulator PhoP
VTTVLVVEDEPDLLLLARRMLEELGYAVIEAPGGEEALELAENQEVDAVLLDLRMPGMDGWAVLDQLRATGTISRLPVIVLSAHADPAAVKRSAELGAKGYVKKPYRVADLTRALEAVHVPAGG